MKKILASILASLVVASAFFFLFLHRMKQTVMILSPHRL